VLPHGVGFQKYVPDSRSAGVRLSGLVPDRYLRNRDVLLLTSHQDQIRQLEKIVPGIAERTAVVGDVCFDRMLASRHLRPWYRDHLGVTESKRLVVISSTWREQSLWGRWPQLPHRLLAELPFDEYQVAMILHPNIWSAHTPWQVRGWLADAVDAGLALIPPTAGWQGTLIAADALIGDHGSVTYYGAALGIPVLVTEFGAEAVPGTPVADLKALAHSIDRDMALRPQLEKAIAEHDPGSSRYLAGLAFENIGAAGRNLRTLLYQRMGLPEPIGTPTAKAWPAPSPETVPVCSFQIVATGRSEHEDRTTVTIQRFPVLPPVPDRTGRDSPDSILFLASYDDEPDPALIESALIVVGRRAGTDPARRARATLHSYPGARIVIIPDGAEWLAASRGGPAVAVTNPANLDPVVLGAAILATNPLVTSPLTSQALKVRLGSHTHSIQLTPITASREADPSQATDAPGAVDP
jgi:hypothetical protein